jgi:hypothetical protein
MKHDGRAAVPMGALGVPLARTQRSRVTNGKEVLPGVDNRLVIARRYRDLLSELVADMGGLETMTQARMQLCRRFAALSVQAESMEAKLAQGEQISLTDHSLISSTLCRLASRLGIERRAKQITPLADYLAIKASPAAKSGSAA